MLSAKFRAVDDTRQPGPGVADGLGAFGERGGGVFQQPDHDAQVAAVETGVSAHERLTSRYFEAG